MDGMPENENIDAKLHGLAHEPRHAHDDGHDHDHDAVIDADVVNDNVTQVHPLDLAAVRAKLKSKTGKQ